MYQPKTQVLIEVNNTLRHHNLNLIPYRTNAEVTVIATQFLRDAVEGLLLRIYVPATRLWANEVDRLLELFRDYLLRTGRKGIRLDQIKTDHGISYEFHGDDAPSASSLSEDFQDFSRFLDLCVSNPEEAEAILRQKSIDPKEIASILTRYSKEAKRLQVDLRHERERKLLNIRQRLESELADFLPNNVDWSVIEKLVASSIPEAFSIVAVSSGSLRGLRSVESSSLTINLMPQIVNTVKGIIAQEIRGDVNISEDDETLLQLIRQHGDNRSTELASAVQVLSDTDIPKSDRLTSAQKLKAFVFSIRDRLGPVATNLMTAYLERKLGLK